MKRMRCVTVLVIAGLTANAFANPITPGNLVVVQFGDGVAALDGKARDVFLREFTTAGTSVQTLAMPTSGSGSNRQFRNTGTNANEGYVKLSTNGQYMTLFGFDAAAGASTGTNWDVMNRVVGRVGMDGTIDTSTVLNDAGVGGNPRSAVMDGSNIWVGAGNSAGLRYATFGTVGTSTQLSSSFNRCRIVSILNGQLYASEQSGPSGHGIYAIGSGLPTTGGQSVSLYVNTVSGSGNPDPLDYWFADASTVYVADNRTAANGGGIQKWTFSGSTWSLAYTLSSGQTAGFRGLTGTMVGGNAVLYATSADASTKLVTVTDTGSTSAFTTLFTAGTNTTLRGVVLTIGEPTGACCDTATGNCAITTQAGCQYSYLGNGTVCNGTQCPLPTGACCDTATGNCTITTQAGCQYSYLGDGVVCNGTTCPVPTGACCDTATGNCTITTQAGCVYSYLGNGSVCNGTTCPVPTGACCDTATNNCTITTQAGCQYSYLGNGSVCNGATCPVPNFAYWRFEEAGGDIAFDSGPNGLNGTLSGWSIYVPFRVTDVPVNPVPQTGAVNGQALDLNWVAQTVGGYVIVPDTAGQLTMGDQDFTIEAWVKLSSLSSPNKDGRQHLAWKNKPNTSNRKNIDYAVLVQRGDSAGTPNFGKSTGFTGRELQLYFGDGTTFWSVTSNLEITDTTNWHYISIAYDTTNDRVRFGIDCQFETIAFTQQPRTTNTGPLVIGAANTGSSTYEQCLRGRIDEVRMTKPVLPLGSLLFSVDCNSNGIPDRCELPPYGTGPDCNSNGIPDECDPDCNGNGIPDDCDVPPIGTGPDCNSNGIPDECDVPPIGTGPDCNSNGIPDACEADCNGNGIPDDCDVPPIGTGSDCNSNGIPDECETDCNHNGIPDQCDVPPIGNLPDVDGNGVPDSCQADCNANGVIDVCELPSGCAVGNCRTVFPAQCGTGQDLNGNGILDACEPDCNGNLVPDDLDIANGTSQDCTGNGIPDECEIWVTDGGLCQGTAPPCSRDLNQNSVPDECEDCNGNGILDEVDIANGTSQDCNGDGIPDECQLSPVYALDDGESDIDVRADGTYMAWMNQFTVIKGFDTITAIEINFHNSAIGKPVALYIWSDPNGDGNPTDAQVLGAKSFIVELGMTDKNYLVRIDIPDTYIGPNGTSFFVGAIVDLALGSGDYPAVGDLDAPSFPGRSWLVGANQPINPNNITAGAVEFGLFENRLPFAGNWMIRPIPLSYTAGDCNANGIPDDCDIASGASLDCQPDGIPDECQLGSWQTTITYKLDDGTATNQGWGLNQNGYIAWMNQFTVVADAEFINILRFAYGDVPAGVYLWVYVWSDPNGDGNPSDAQVLSATKVATCGTAQWCDVEIPPTYIGPVGTSFFVGAILEGQNQDPVTMDGHTVLQRTWVVARFASPIDPNNLGAGADYLGLIDNYNIPPGNPYPGTAFIRAKGCQRPNDQNANGVPDECDHEPGDVNCDHVVNVDDIPYFVAALIGGYTGCDISLADMDGSGTVDGLDIQGFVNAVLAP